MACIASIAIRCSNVANLFARPSSSTTPSPFNTTGMMSASHAIRRTVSTGNGIPESVSQSVVS
ncbi:hypothetical protein [Ilumatobacter sp.]|uniref:hypothetical protein n=1 Tax=Ilumatobacter sp. TaxID=1967498 RepID=UPI00345C6D37